VWDLALAELLAWGYPQLSPDGRRIILVGARFNQDCPGVAMLIGKRFRLERATVAVNVSDRKRTACPVPAGAIINVLPDPADAQDLVTVLWKERKLQMFAVDIDSRGTEIKGPDTEHGQSSKTATG
jgi:hypothetical protein